MLSPDYLLRVSEGGEAIAETLHNEIIKQIVERIALRLDRGDDYILTARDKWQIEVLQDAGFLREDIEKAIAKYTGLMQTEIAEAMEEAGVKAIDDDNEVYQAAGLSPLPLGQSPHLIRLMQRTYEATAGEWINFTRTTADASQQQFIQACDKAYTMVASGASGYGQAFVDAINGIVENGVRVTYPSGHTDTIETATLRCIRTGVSQATAEITDARMDEMDWDIILVSSHLGARVTDKQDFTNHYWWQGKFYSKSGKDDRFPPFSVCGMGYVQGIHGANCRHQHGPGDGEFNPYDQYDSEKNRKAYELQQRQRAMERRIRESKRKCVGLKQGLDSATTDEGKELAEKAYQKQAALLKKRNQAYNQFCDDNNLKRRNERIAIAKWDRSQAAKARAAAKKWNSRPEEMERLPKKDIDNNPKSDTIKEINRVDYEEGRKVQRTISNILRTEPENIKLDGIPVQSQRYVLSAARKVADKFPQLKGYTKKISYNPNIPGGVIARSKSLSGIIEVGPDFLDLEELQKTHNYGIKLKYNPKGTEDLASTIVHEFGHQLDGYLTLKGVYGGSVSQYGVTRTSVAVQKEVLRRMSFTDEKLREIRRQYAVQGFSGEKLNHAVRFERQDFIERHLSSYAYENSNEFFAEAFSEYMMSDKPRELAKVFGEVLEEIMEAIT